MAAQGDPVNNRKGHFLEDLEEALLGRVKRQKKQMVSPVSFSPS